MQFGNLTGYRAAKATCEAACGDALAHLCSAEEITRSLQVGALAPYPANNLWYTTATRYDPSGVAIGDCDGWECGQPGRQSCTTEAAHVVQNQDRLISYFTCNNSNYLACCL